MVRALQTSSAFHPWISRMVRTSRWASGNEWIACSSTAIVSLFNSCASGSRFQGLGATDQWSGYSSLDEWNLAESTAGSASSTSLSAKSEKETIRLSRPLRVLANLISIREIHVSHDD